MAKIMTERRPDATEIAARKAVKPQPKPKPNKELLKIENAPLHVSVALMFWKLRNQFPEFAMTFTPTEVAEYNASMKYQEQEPQVIIDAGERFLTIRVQDIKTQDMIRVSESTEEALQIAEQAKRTKRLKEQAPLLASTVKGELSQGIISNESINALCEAALAMARS